jgi:hypothetical protein
MTYHRACNKSNTTDATRGEEATYLSGTSEFTSVISGVRVAQFLVFYVAVSRSLFVFFGDLFLLAF